MKKMMTLALGLSLLAGSAFAAPGHPGPDRSRGRNDARHDNGRKDGRKDGGRHDDHRGGQRNDGRKR
jgi:hypothetical protein